MRNLEAESGVVQGCRRGIGLAAAAAHGPVLAARTVSLGGEIALLARLHGMLDAEHHAHPIGVELHQDHRERGPWIAVEPEPAIHGPVGRPKALGTTGGGEAHPQAGELMLFLLDRRNGGLLDRRNGGLLDWRRSAVAWISCTWPVHCTLPIN